jgi:DNA invertase Pin-like site-specific DNA recombinase
MPMSEKITARHLRRSAILYVRQSTVQQVLHHQESRRLQYAMRERLEVLGWKDVMVIDDDLGRSASGCVERAGFDRLVAAVTLGDVGIIGARELSRFARNSRDWQKLLEVCRYVDTLLADQDAVYDARSSNDRLLLGLKGSLNEYELDLLRLRAQEARIQKARRGELIISVAVGYRKSDDGRLEITPDVRVQHAVRLAFDKTLELGSARQCLLWLRAQEVEVPINRNQRGDVLWRAPSYPWLYQVITNPVYAGAYVFGRTTLETVFVDGEPRRHQRRRQRDEWMVLQHDHHPAYIHWDRFEQVQQMLSKNSQRRRHDSPGAPKVGSALLSGVLRCRRCGNKMLVAYSSGRSPRYSCDRINDASGTPRCIGFSAQDVDRRVANAVLDVVRPAGIEAARRTAVASSNAHDDARTAISLERDAARYAADRAFRQYDAIDPENRLVASELERRWNEALKHLQAIEDRLRAYDEHRPTIPDEALLTRLGEDLARVWDAPSTDVRLKKRIVRTVIEEIIADVTDQEILLLIHWKGGVHTELRCHRQRRGFNRKRTPPDVIAAARSLARVCRDDQIAQAFTRAGVLTATGRRWTSALVTSLRSAHDIPAYSQERATAEGWLMLEEAAKFAGVSPYTLRHAVERGILIGEQPITAGPWIFQRADLERSEIRARLRHGPASRAAVDSTIQLSLISRTYQGGAV